MVADVDLAIAAPATVLALDTTTSRGSAAVWRHGHEPAILATAPDRSYGEQLPGLLATLLEQQGLGFRDVELFAVAAGPGSLTGLRVGIATVQGLAVATRRPVVAVTALDALAVAALETGPGCRRTIGACMNAFRGEVFAALYRTPASDDAEEPSVVDPPGVGYPAEVAVRWRALAEASDLIVVGDSVPAFSESLDGVLGPGVRFQPGPLLAGIVARMARARALRGGAVAPHAVHPVYLRRPDAEVARERGAAPRVRITEP